MASLREEINKQYDKTLTGEIVWIAFWQDKQEYDWHSELFVSPQRLSPDTWLVKKADYDRMRHISCEDDYAVFICIRDGKFFIDEDDEMFIEDDDEFSGVNLKNDAAAAIVLQRYYNAVNSGEDEINAFTAEKMTATIDYAYEYADEANFTDDSFWFDFKAVGKKFDQWLVDHPNDAALMAEFEKIFNKKKSSRLGQK